MRLLTSLPGTSIYSSSLIRLGLVTVLLTFAAACTTPTPTPSQPAATASAQLNPSSSPAPASIPATPSAPAISPTPEITPTPTPEITPTPTPTPFPGPTAVAQGSTGAAVLGFLGTKLTLDDNTVNPIDLLAVHVSIFSLNGQPLAQPTLYMQFVDGSRSTASFGAVDQAIDLKALAAGQPTEGWIGFWISRSASSGTLVIGLANEHEAVGTLDVTWQRTATP